MTKFAANLSGKACGEVPSTNCGVVSEQSYEVKSAF